MLNAVKKLRNLWHPRVALGLVGNHPTCRGLGSISQIPLPLPELMHMQSLVPPVLHELQKECTYFFLMNISSSVGLFFLTTVTPTGGLPKPGLAALPLRAG